MQIVELSVGDIVRKNSGGGRYLITSLNPIKGLPQYVSLMDKNGHSEDIWVNFIKEKVGSIDLSFVFSSLTCEDSESVTEDG